MKSEGPPDDPLDDHLHGLDVLGYMKVISVTFPTRTWERDYSIASYRGCLVTEMSVSEVLARALLHCEELKKSVFVNHSEHTAHSSLTFKS